MPTFNNLKKIQNKVWLHKLLPKEKKVKIAPTPIVLNNNLNKSKKMITIEATTKKISMSFSNLENLYMTQMHLEETPYSKKFQSNPLLHLPKNL